LPCAGNQQGIDALKLVIATKNYSFVVDAGRGWRCEPTTFPFDEVFIPLYTGEADKKTDF